MAVRVLPEARDDLRNAVRYYRDVPPPALGKQLAARVMAAFRGAMVLVAQMPLIRPEHPDIPGTRYVMLGAFPYMAFYVATNGETVVVAVEYATRDYVDRVAKRIKGAR